MREYFDNYGGHLDGGDNFQGATSNQDQFRKRVEQLGPAQTRRRVMCVSSWRPALRSDWNDDAGHSGNAIIGSCPCPVRVPLNVVVTLLRAFDVWHVKNIQQQGRIEYCEWESFRTGPAGRCQGGLPPNQREYSGRMCAAVRCGGISRRTIAALDTSCSKAVNAQLEWNVHNKINKSATSRSAGRRVGVADCRFYRGLPFRLVFP